MRSQIWIHEETGKMFYKTSEYLDFMRQRRTDRMALARLRKSRTAALERLQAIYEVNRFYEIEEFLNEHRRDIEMACRTRETRAFNTLSSRIYVSLLSEVSDHWKVQIKYACERDRVEKLYRENELAERRPLMDNRRRWSEFRCDSINDVFEALGFESHGGGGSSTGLSYRMAIPKLLFPSVTVMEKLAAA